MRGSNDLENVCREKRKHPCSLVLPLADQGAPQNMTFLSLPQPQFCILLLYFPSWSGPLPSPTPNPTYSYKDRASFQEWNCSPPCWTLETLEVQTPPPPLESVRAPSESYLWPQHKSGGKNNASFWFFWKLSTERRWTGGIFISSLILTWCLSEAMKTDLCPLQLWIVTQLWYLTTATARRPLWKSLTHRPQHRRKQIFIHPRHVLQDLVGISQWVVF